MEQLLEFSRGPLFRLSFAIMILGLARIIILDIWSAREAFKRAGDQAMPWGLIIRRSLEWFFPVKRVFNNRPVYSLVSILFHIGLIITPIFLFAHMNLVENSIGLSWPTIPYGWAYALTGGTIIFGLMLFFGRVFSKSSSHVSRVQDYFWPLILLVPFVTGFLCAHGNVGPGAYQFFMLVHVLAGNLIFILIPFTKIAHCVLMPFSQLVCTLGWKFPPETDDKIATTLNKKGAPV